MQRKFMLIGALMAMLSVAIGAFGAHMLGPIVGESAMKVYETGVQYHMAHALGMILIALTAGVWGDSRKLAWAGWLLFAGIILFSGSLYLLTVTGVKALGIITPFGGVAFIAGWICLMAEAMTRKKK
ncbi:DUF423 domain-containing protein [Paenibacillus sp.]|jgi:uncharacterized membrane protein YgdD (TMEM256/DUF423 family)|uniref:DUF423 domain-containing protein n=1 Tax=Paenibacillus sp. TaxID=58172 RepID=UPI0028274904|nr:DUF423 domain-containing protein [Paenibacillus sp.]MDR0269127.1 DUF423 domain-containing protein [Paenibacillus sp.]